MKRNLLFVVLAITGLLLWMSSCQKAPELTLTGPTNFELSADGGSATINFTANRDWRVNSSDDWITISPSSGAASNGTIAVLVKCNANTTYDDRAATVTISMEGPSQSVTVKQSANTGVLVPKTSFELTNSAQTIEVEVQKNINYTVEIEESCKSWIKKVETKGLISEKISFEIAENTNYDARMGTITIVPFTGPEQTVVVNQAARPVLNILRRSPEGELVPEGCTVEIFVQTNVEFDVSSTSDWIHYVQTKASDREIDGKTVVLTVNENKTYNSREGTVIIKQHGGSLEGSISFVQFSTAVDLGIVMTRTDGSTYKLYWATRNLGASTPTELGDRYAWGETETKEDSDWSNYKWAKGAMSKLTKYCSALKTDWWGGEGDPDDKLVLDPEDDVAYIKLGSKWRMPTVDEWKALFYNCESYVYNGMWTITGNGVSIELPFSGYWSPLIDYQNPGYAYSVVSQQGYAEPVYPTDPRIGCRYIRPVFEE